MATRWGEHNNPFYDSEPPKRQIVWIKISSIVATGKYWQRFLTIQGHEKT